MKQKIEIDIEIIEELLKNQTSKEMLFQSFNFILPNKTNKNYLSFCIIILLSMIPSVLIGFSSDTISLIKSSAEKINEAMIALFGIVFTGYAFFQALINKELLLRMLSSDEGDKDSRKKQVKKSRLQISNEYFVKVMMLQGFSIIISLFLGISLDAIPNNWSLFDNLIMNNSIAFLAIWLYLSFNFLIVWEIKSFVFNVFQLFNAHAGAKVLTMLNGKQNEED